MSIEKEKLLKRTSVYEGNLLHVFEDDVELAGKETKREVILHGGAAAIIPITDQKEVLMVKQYRYAVEKAILEIPAGKLDQGETIETCAKRELEEETGYQGELTPLGFVYTTPGFCNERIDLFLATSLKKTHQHLDPNEYLDVVAVPISKLLERVTTGEIVDAKTLSAIAIAYPILQKML